MKDVAGADIRARIDLKQQQLTDKLTTLGHELKRRAPEAITTAAAEAVHRPLLFLGGVAGAGFLLGLYLMPRRSTTERPGVLRLLFNGFVLPTLEAKALTWVGEAWRAAQMHRHDEASVDEASLASFPASDPPAFAGGL